MVLASGTTFSPASQVFLLLNWVFQVCSDSHTIQSDFTVDPKLRPGLPWCEVQGQVNGNMFLYFPCGSKKAKLFGPLGMEVNTTKSWEWHKKLWKPWWKNWKKKLLDFKQKFSEDGPLTMWGRIMYQLKDDECSSGSLWFGFSGPMCLFFLLEDRHWISSTFWR